MFSEMSLAPRYRLDDESPWLKGTDPMRRYWIHVNGEQGFLRALPGLKPNDFETFRQAIIDRLFQLPYTWRGWFE